MKGLSGVRVWPGGRGHQDPHGVGGDGDQGQTGHAQVQHVAGVCITGFIVLELLIIRLADRKPFLVRGELIPPHTIINNRYY